MTQDPHAPRSTTVPSLMDRVRLAFSPRRCGGQTTFRRYAAAGWMLAAFALLQAVGIALDVGFRRGAEAAGTDRAVSYALEFVSGLGPYAGSYIPGGAMTFTLLTPAHVVLMLLAALIGGRAWRLMSRR